MQTKKRTEIAALGQFGLIDRLTHGFSPKNPSTLRGVGDDAAVIAPPAGEELLCSTDSFFEGVDFDLTYFPLKHLGYKVVTAGVSDILAMNARPSQIVLSLGVSAKLPVEALDDLYEGVRFACNEQGKILPRRLTGTSQKFQKKVAQAVKRARHLAILPFVTDCMK